MIPKRAGLVIWVNDLRAARNLERVGSIHFISRRLKYVVMYISERDLKKTISYLERLPFVLKVERSYRSEIIHMNFSKKGITQ